MDTSWLGVVAAGERGFGQAFLLGMDWFEGSACSRSWCCFCSDLEPCFQWMFMQEPSHQNLQ